MFCANEFRAQLVRKGYTQQRLANEIGISAKTLTLKIKSGKFGTDEVQKIMKALDIRDPNPIFFGME